VAQAAASPVVATYDNIVQEAQRLLRAAEVRRRLPTPVEDLVAAAGLVRGSDEIFAEHVLARAPKELQDAVRRLAGKVRAMLDRKAREIYVNPGITIDGRRNFQTLHEVGHHILPWQRELAYADDDERLSWLTQMRLEREANQTAAELLFQCGFFTEVAAHYAIGIASVIELAEIFGASIHAAFRRYVETHRAPLCGVVIDCNHCHDEPLSYRRREAVCSGSWEPQFGSATNWPNVLAQPRFTFLSHARDAYVGSPPVSDEWSCADLNNTNRALRVELFSNHYRTFVLIWVPQRERLKRRRIAVAS
jgi:hypothetical protein